jgi:hypothetical protein
MLHHLRLESGKKLFPPERPGRGTPPTLRREGYVIWLRLRRAGFPVVKRSGQERAHGLPVAEFGQPPRVAGVSLHPAFHSRLARPRFLKGGGSTGAGIRREHREYGDRPWRTVSRKSTRRWAGRSRWGAAPCPADCSAWRLEPTADSGHAGEIRRQPESLRHVSGGQVNHRPDVGAGPPQSWPCGSPTDGPDEH